VYSRTFFLAIAKDLVCNKLQQLERPTVRVPRQPVQPPPRQLLLHKITQQNS
jgi:hypothetical protein